MTQNLAQQAPTPDEALPRPFGIRDKLGYLFGDWGNDFTFLFASTYLMVFYTNVVGLNPAHVGTLFLAARILDAFTDVGWGHLLDRMRPASTGRFRPWIRRMAVPVVVASSLMYFFGIADWSYGAKMTYAAVTYLLWGSVCYTSINIPYGSMASVITSDPGERSQLSVFRSFGATLAGIIVTLVPPLFLYVTIEGVSQVVPENFLWGAIGVGVLAIGCYLACYHLVTERVRKHQPAQGSGKGRGFGGLIVSLFSNRALLSLIASNIVLFLAAMLSNTMLPYVWLYHFNDGRLSGPGGLVNYIPIIVLAPIAAALASRLGKKEIIGVGALLAGAIYVVVYFLHIHNPWVYIGLMMIAGFGTALYTMLVWAMVTDVIDYEEVRSGERDDGTVYALNTWARKLSQAIAGGLGGYALGWVGFNAEATTQSESTVGGIYMFATLVPGVLYLIVGLFILFVYPLSKQRVEQNAVILQERAAAAGRGANHQ
ncbi:glycoside-pentoside-hexuronide (GPH):cation symporter [Actinomyces sp. MRS3W]|uniref:MFS transporter n=1 Tax=Actinomyces sp. MRS3W TaxID=2800796 RepID=UPI0028FCFB94|nr:glycoside-pentoside-hexuronide (GPH):cation symporter [Actinomyces sp. MRS3W]MDU0348361.1 glycoside-pentoside-hexuronide (GPH):cation symporter [Actinomyces sp. MRS3W]